MVIIEKPYVSEMFLKYLENSEYPVLANDFANTVTEYKLNLVDDDKMVEVIKENNKVYSNSENALDWMYNHLDDEFCDKISQLKDKVIFRGKLNQVYDDFFYMEVSIDGLDEIKSSELKYPCVIKPAVGFLSLDVYTIFNDVEWEKVKNTIKENLANSKAELPSSVYGQGRFIIEEYIEGEEVAVDFYYNALGEPVVLNILKHIFASKSDVGDRVYYTGKNVINQYKTILENYLAEVNQVFQLVNFPIHAEIRINGDKLCPIEFNPMRFAGLCVTDIAFHAYGINTVDCLLNDVKPDFDNLLKGKDGKLYCYIQLDKPANANHDSKYNYDKLMSGFKNVLELRKISNPGLPVFGLMFVEVDENDMQELDNILKSDMIEYLM